MASVALAAGCAAGSDVDDGASGPSTSVGGASVPERPVRTVRVGLSRDPFSLDPRLVADDEGELVVRALFDGLVDIAPGGSIVAAAAASWTIEDEGLTYRFRLRDDRFHDGSTVTAQHHADALLAVFDTSRAPLFREDLLGRLRGAVASEPPPAGDEGAPRGDADDPPEDGSVEEPARRWGTPEDVLAAGGVEVLGASELVLRLARPDPLLLHRLADPVLVPLPRSARLDPEGFALEPVGNGPFRMTGPREPGAFIRLRADRDHPSPPRIDELVLQVYADDAGRAQRWSDLLAGRLQITAIPVDLRGEARDRFGTPVEGRIGAGLHELPLTTLYAYGFVLDVAPYDDVELRRAISAAIDRESLARDLAAAGVEAAIAIFPESAGGEVPECAHCRYDPQLAEELIASWRERLPDAASEPRITLTYPRGGGHVTIAERIAADLERVLGVEVRLQSRDFGALVRAVAAGEAPLFRYGLRAQLGGRAATASLLEDALRTDGAQNLVRWRDPATDVLLDAWTPAAASDIVREIELQVLDRAAIIPLLWTRQDLVVHPDVLGFRADPTGRWWPELIRLR
jgi:oligopeptide transport system substrate-binding protein